MAKYLYYSDYACNNLYRAEISRETDFNIWLKNSIGNEISQPISKKTMSRGDHNYSKIYYYIETPELLEKYKIHFKKRKIKRSFREAIKYLTGIEDETLMLKIINITGEHNNGK